MSDASTDGSGMSELDPQLKELFLPFRVFCTRKDVSIQARNFKQIPDDPHTHFANHSLAFIVVIFHSNFLNLSSIDSSDHQ